jgi:hypothetical protein
MADMHGVIPRDINLTQGRNIALRFDNGCLTSL